MRKGQRRKLNLSLKQVYKGLIPPRIQSPNGWWFMSTTAQLKRALHNPKATLDQRCHLYGLPASS